MHTNDVSGEEKKKKATLLHKQILQQVFDNIFYS